MSQLFNSTYYPVTVANVSGLTSIIPRPADGQIVQTLGYYTPGDGGDNSYIYSASTSGAVNWGSIMDGIGGDNSTATVQAAASGDGSGVGRFLSTDTSTEQNMAKWGVLADGTTDNSKRVRAAILDGNVSTLTFQKGVSLFNAIVDGGFNRRALFKGAGPSSEIQSYSNNEFCIVFQKNSSAPLCGIQNLIISGDGQTKHGVCVSYSSHFSMNDCWVEACGIGLCSNGTIDGTYVSCRFRDNYVGMYFTSRDTSTTVPDVAGQTVTIPAVVAIPGTHQSKQSFHGVFIFNGTFGFISDAPDLAFDAAADYLFSGCLIEGNDAVGLWLRQDLGANRYFAPGSNFDNVWFESNATASGTFDGETPDICDILVGEGTSVNMRHCRASSYNFEADSIIRLDQCGFPSNTVFSIDEAASVIGYTMRPDNRTLPFIVEGLGEGRGGRESHAYSAGFVNKSKGLGNPVYNNDFAQASGFATWGSPVFSYVSDGVLDGVDTCLNVVSSSDTHGVQFTHSVTSGQIYFMTMAFKSISGVDVSFATSANGGFQRTVPIPNDNQWYHIQSVERSDNTGARVQLIRTSAAGTYRISAVQVHEFNNIKELYEFQLSHGFSTS